MDVTDVVNAVRRRWRTVLACILLAGAAAGAFLYTRNETLEPTRYEVSVHLLVPGRDPEGSGQDNELPDELPERLLIAQTRLALESETVRQALQEAGYPDGRPRFAASLSESRTEITLRVISQDLPLAEAVATAWADVFIERRRDIVLEELRDEQVGVVSTVVTERAALAELESELRAKVGDPIPDIAIGQAGDDETTPVPPDLFNFDHETTFQLFERSEIRTRILEMSQRYAENASDARTPTGFAQVVDVPPPVTVVPESSSPVTPVAAILAGGVALGLVGAVVLDRRDRSIRDAKRASTAFNAPVLSRVPARQRGDDEFAFLLASDTERSEAYRVLAATSVATDRLPRAIMVSSPSGLAHEDVAVNFAAALSTLGVRVALVATSPRQSWFLRSVTVPERGISTFPELLALAQSGRLNGHISDTLPRIESLPNLVVVPPGKDNGLVLPFDGLPPLLEALANADVDVTVIAGPALLESADATIVAWATGSVMWAVEVGDASESEAADAVARLELAGVKTFGIAVVEPA